MKRLALAAVLPCLALLGSCGHRDTKPADHSPSGEARVLSADEGAKQAGLPVRTTEERAGPALPAAYVHAEEVQAKRRAELQKAVAEARTVGGIVTVRDGKPTVIAPPRR